MPLIYVLGKCSTKWGNNTAGVIIPLLVFESQDGATFVGGCICELRGLTNDAAFVNGRKGRMTNLIVLLGLITIGTTFVNEKR